MASKLLISGYLFGSLLLVISILIFVFENTLITSLVKKSVQLVPSTDLYKDWLHPPFDVHMKMYIYNLKNGADFIKGKKPVFEEIGPFVYKESRIKEDLQDNLNYTISYKERKVYTFIPELSTYQESYPITTMNIAAMTVLNLIQHSRSIEHTIVNQAFELTGESMIVTKTAGEILWGYTDPLLHELNKVVPFIVNSDQVGLMIGQNGTIDGEYTIYTGVDDVSKIGVIERYNRETTVSMWPTKYANMINGSDGTLSNPFVDKSARSYGFQPQLCRSVYGVYHDTITLHDNIDVWGFAGNDYIYGNATVNPENGDFCTPLGNCLGAGLLNLTVCMKMGNINLPIIMSNPHFLYGDGSNLAAVDGISPPDMSLHNTVVYVEPLTGIEMKANQRLQLNMNCINDSRITVAQDLNNLFFPLMWLDECFEVDNKTADKFYYQLKFPLLIINIVKYTLCAIGSILFAAAVIFSIRKSYKKNKNPTEVNTESTNWISNETTPLLNN